MWKWCGVEKERIAEKGAPLGEKKRKVLIALYIFFILWVTLFSREVATVRVFKGLFWEARNHLWHFIVLNILLFIPLGSLLRSITDSWKTIVCGFLLAVLIELTQYWFRLGSCELDDVLNNTIGAAIGALLFKKFGKRIEQFIKKHSE